MFQYPEFLFGEFRNSSDLIAGDILLDFLGSPMASIESIASVSGHRIMLTVNPICTLGFLAHREEFLFVDTDEIHRVAIHRKVATS